MDHPVYSRNVGYCSTGHRWIQEVTCDFTCDISSHQPLGPQDLYLHESYILQFKERPQRTLKKKKNKSTSERPSTTFTASGNTSICFWQLYFGPNFPLIPCQSPRAVLCPRQSRSAVDIETKPSSRHAKLSGGSHEYIFIMQMLWKKVSLHWWWVSVSRSLTGPPGDCGRTKTNRE